MSDTTPHDPENMRGSLVAEGESWRLDQPSFFPDLLGNVEAEEARGEFTGERLEARHPEKYRAIVEFLAEPKISESFIARVCKVSRNTVAAVRKRAGIPIEQVKEKILLTAQDAQLMTAERLVELIPSMNARDAVIAFGVITEKVQLMRGEATVITGTAVADKAKHADLNAWLETLPQADAREVPGMGSSGDMVEQKGLPGPVLEMGPTDIQSVNSQSNQPRSNGEGNKTGGNRPENEEADQQGGRGSASDEGGSNPNSL